jgi:hypothetical protein
MSAYTDELNEKIGPCPTCGKKTWWYNDIPLKAFCWGSEDNEHQVVIIEDVEKDKKTS